MKSLINLFLLLSISIACLGQAEPVSAVNTEKETAIKAWLADLYTVGVETKDGKMTFNQESQKILNQTEYHQFLFPNQYNWQVTQALLQRNALKQAFWYLINLYHQDEQNQEKVLATLLTYEKIIEVDRALITSYYSYIAFDPQVATIKEGRVGAIHRPDIAEQKLLITKHLVNQILAHRKQKPKE